MSNQFISLLESISSTKHADLINSVLNGYILTESFFGNRKLPPSTDNKPSTYGKNIEDLSSKQQNAIKELPSDEARSFEYDYKQLGKNCITIIGLSKVYGSSLFKKLISSPEFKSAMKLGDILDSTRKNPLLEMVEKRHSFMHFLESLKNNDNKLLISDIMKLYVLTEAIGNIKEIDDDDDKPSSLVPDNEGYSYDIKQTMKNAVSGIETFMKKHGAYPVRKFLQSKDLKDALLAGYDIDIRKNQN